MVQRHRVQEKVIHAVEQGDRETMKQTDRERDSQIHTHTHRQTSREKGSEIHRQRQRAKRRDR